MRGFQAAFALAGGAGLAQNVFQAFAAAFACELHQAQPREAVEGNARAVKTQRFGQLLQYGFAVLIQHHVDKINDDDAAQIAQPQLAGDGVAGFQIGFKNGFVKIARAHKAARVHVDCGHRLGGFNNQIAAKV